MEALALAQVIKSDLTISATRLVLLAPLGKGMSSEELKRSGIAACLVKPVKQSRLFDCLINYVDLLATESAIPKSASIQSTSIPQKPIRNCSRSASFWPKITLSTKELLWANYANSATKQMRSPTVSKCWKLSSESLTPSLLWIARCRKWMGT